MRGSPTSGHPLIPSAPKFRTEIAALFRAWGVVMGTANDHYRSAEDCIVNAQRSETDGDRALWLMLARSWVQLAEDAARDPAEFAGSSEAIPEAAAPDEE